MNDGTIGVAAPAGNVDLPSTRAACRVRLAALHDEVAAIRAQIAAADLDRQAKGGRIDARWFHRAKTALRHRRRELALLTGHTASLPIEPGRRDRFKDALIEVLREGYDDAAWQRVLAAARELQREREAG